MDEYAVLVVVIVNNFPAPLPLATKLRFFLIDDHSPAAAASIQ